jgi:hypothetical protein
MQLTAAFFRVLRAPGPEPLTPVELNRMARKVVGAIDNETGNRTAHSQRVAQLYAVARQIQHAAEAKCGEMTAHKIISFLATVFMRSYLPRLVPR